MHQLPGEKIGKENIFISLCEMVFIEIGYVINNWKHEA